MHEMSILSNVIDVVLKYAQENNVREVVSVTLVVGELRDVADKLMEHDKDDPEKMDAYLHKIQTSSQHLLSLINDVLDMSKIESSEVTLGREPISLADQVAQIDSIIRSQAESRCQRSPSAFTSLPTSTSSATPCACASCTIYPDGRTLLKAVAQVEQAVRRHPHGRADARDERPRRHARDSPRQEPAGAHHPHHRHDGQRVQPDKQACLDAGTNAPVVPTKQAPPPRNQPATNLQPAKTRCSMPATRIHRKPNAPSSHLEIENRSCM